MYTEAALEQVKGNQSERRAVPTRNLLPIEMWQKLNTRMDLRTPRMVPDSTHWAVCLMEPDTGWTSLA